MSKDDEFWIYVGIPGYQFSNKGGVKKSKPMNYDFKANWYDIILPLLQTIEMQNAILDGILAFIDSDNTQVEYNENNVPADYGIDDYWCELYTDHEEYICDKLIETGTLYPMNYMDYNSNNDDENEDKYFRYRSRILQPYMDHFQKTSFDAYRMMGACHWWNPTFGLTLAKIVYPTEKWEIIHSELHTTVINSDGTLVFDILFYTECDETFGGKCAVEQASCVINFDGDEEARLKYLHDHW